MQRGEPSFERLNLAVGRLARWQIGTDGGIALARADDHGGWAHDPGDSRASPATTALALSVMRTRPPGATLREPITHGLAFLHRYVLARPARLPRDEAPPRAWLFPLLGLAVATRPWDPAMRSDPRWRRDQSAAVARCLHGLAWHELSGGGWPGSHPDDDRFAPTITARAIIALANAVDHGWINDADVHQHLRRGGCRRNPFEMLLRAQERLLGSWQAGAWSNGQDPGPSVAATSLAILALERARRAGLLAPSARVTWDRRVKRTADRLLLSAPDWCDRTPVEREPWEHRLPWHHPVYALALRACLAGDPDPLAPALRRPIEALERRWSAEQGGWVDAIPRASGRVTVLGIHSAATTLESLRRSFGVVDPIGLYRRVAVDGAPLRLVVRERFVVSLETAGGERVDEALPVATHATLRAFARASRSNVPAGVLADQESMERDLAGIGTSTYGSRIDRANDHLRRTFGAELLGGEDVLRRVKGLGQTRARIPVTLP